ncbi:hypothetical protein [Lysobacter niastensis]|uniref:Uncharacterized protein n=1 Tax=Lysobacter niastensis TaxID=380629 RepID=A0ABS0B8S0_9GAMM|nr:hypothetical protein [Lysobacter niastensis]MBF6025404.1 hypothetical protein [Lysobacter niastensis]
MTSNTTHTPCLDGNVTESFTSFATEHDEHPSSIVIDHPPCWARKPRVTCIPRRHRMNPGREFLRFLEFMLPEDEFDFPTLGALNGQRLLAAQRVIVAAIRNHLDPEAAARSLAQEARRYPYSQFDFDELDAAMMLADMRALERKRTA